ncbi:nitroreductase family protein [Halobacillus litoralis]|uniref:Nitroreductase domain-containing protein n=1 Tax=Halobacillus litoralis TaxID=45668 RepID=A0A410MBV1_9BACI|nr:nitroreductase family protein [Halobacillus litoralis]QAS52232.1 hypothetical protein HLI_08310 [Halobacillus litoralis]
MWKWDYKVGFENMFIDYHLSTINAPEYTSTQVYQHRERTLERTSGLVTKDLSFSLHDPDNFEKTLLDRRTWVTSFPQGRILDEQLIAHFAQIAFIGGEGERRTYPSGGAQYYVNIHFLFNENIVSPDLVHEGNICEVDADHNQLVFKDHIPWSTIQKSFIQEYLGATAQCAIVLSVPLSSISKKYTDISYKLVQQEAGHIGQNIQLVSTHLELKSVPLGGFYDMELSHLIGGRETVLYTFLIG